MIRSSLSRLKMYCVIFFMDFLLQKKWKNVIKKAKVCLYDLLHFKIPPIPLSNHTLLFTDTTPIPPDLRWAAWRCPTAAFTAAESTSERRPLWPWTCAWPSWNSRRNPWSWTEMAALLWERWEEVNGNSDMSKILIFALSELPFTLYLKM